MNWANELELLTKSCRGNSRLVAAQGVLVRACGNYSSLKGWISAEYECWGTVADVVMRRGALSVSGILDSRKYIIFSRQLNQLRKTEGRLFGVPCRKYFIKDWCLIHSHYRKLMYFISNDKKHIKVLGCSEPAINLSMSCCLNSLIICSMVRKGGVVFHAAVVKYINSGILVPGDSGNGKTTIALLLGRRPDFALLANDKCCLFIKNENLCAYTVPQNVPLGLGLIHALGWGRAIGALAIDSQNLHPGNHKILINRVCSGNYFPIYRKSGREYKYHLLAKHLPGVFNVALVNQAEIDSVLIPTFRPNGSALGAKRPGAGNQQGNSALGIRDEEFLELLTVKERESHEMNSIKIAAAISEKKSFQIAISKDAQRTEADVYACVMRNCSDEVKNRDNSI